jgi:hypothetical protein
MVIYYDGKSPLAGGGVGQAISATGGAGVSSTSGYCRVVGTPLEEFRLRLDHILHDMWYEINCCLDDNELPLVNPEVNFISRKKLTQLINRPRAILQNPFDRVPDHLIPSSGLKDGTYHLENSLFTKIN